MLDTAPVIDGDTLLAQLEELATIGRGPGGGVTRLALSDEDFAARALVGSWMGGAGLHVTTDAAANLVGTLTSCRPGPALVVGSHLDTVVEGGWLDGAYGVLAGVAVARALCQAGRPLRHPLRVVAFTDEEGTTLPGPMWGSRAVVGDAAAVGADPSRRLREAGGDPSRPEAAVWRDGSVAAFLELHIEQGPRLEAMGVDIGVVDSVAGRAVVDVAVRGEQQHAGTTPMEDRADALAAAARVILAVRDAAGHPGVLTATAGGISAAPNLRNVIAGRVTVAAELRALDRGALDRSRACLRGALDHIAAEEQVVIDLDLAYVVEPVAFDPRLVALVDAAARTLGAGTVRLPSLAGHDAQVVARRFPAAMVFVPSRGGRSHVAAEDTAAPDLVLGAEVLLDTVLRADRELS
jgi:N-carbamoyl-L-amino-acid hydrolase